ncbi:hypothetical protein GCM10011348_16290 [Marinobacterium nitratireducens]|uniref:Phasin family protein n=1 Tax=Marinobacterium nitratireducens TaxID=518897 RepID=A0A918DRL4_9GAMM|nr:hypothetical protein [Marinobacterium nitratireducens]GGO80173.1 hypothetical protein GCM10011348_16290 [Marinobacterium nitratireducens]
MQLDFIGSGNLTHLGQQLLESNLELAGSALNSTRDILDRSLELNRDLMLAGLGLAAKARQQAEQLQGTVSEQGAGAEQGLQQLVENGTQLVKAQLQDVSNGLHAQRVKLGTHDIQSLDEPIRATQELGFKLLSIHGRLINQARSELNAVSRPQADESPAAEADAS